MTGNVRVVTQPIVEPVSPEEVKLFIRQYDTSLDSVLALLIPLIRGLAEDYVNRAAMLQTLEYSLDEVPSDWVTLPRPPYSSLVSITFYNSDGTSTAMTLSDFDTVSVGDATAVRLKPDKTWPNEVARSVGCVVIRYKAGATVYTEVPQSFRLGILTAIVGCIDDPANANLSDTAMRVLDAIREVPV